MRPNAPALLMLPNPSLHRICAKIRAGPRIQALDGLHISDMKKLKERIARYSPRQLLTLKLSVLALGLVLAFPPWLTCGRFPASWGGGCKWLPPYGWDFVLTVVSDEYKIINFVLLFLEVALITAVGSYLMERFSTEP